MFNISETFSMFDTPHASLSVNPVHTLPFGISDKPVFGWLLVNTVFTNEYAQPLSSAGGLQLLTRYPYL